MSLKYPHLIFSSFTALNKLKALQLSTVATIKHQRSKKADTMDRSHLNQKHMKMQIARVCSQKVFKMSTICTDTHAWRRFLHWSSAVSIISCRKSDHTAIKHSFSILRTVNEQKAKCWYFACC